MTGLEIVLLVAAAAVSSSLLTVAILWIVARRALDRELEARLGAAGAEVEQRVVAGIERAAEELLPRLRRQVEAGARDAADEILPRFRQEVGEGVREALLGKAGERLARTGSNVLGAGLDLLLGRESDDRERG